MNRVTDDLISRTVLLKDLSYCAPELWHDEEYVKAKIMKQHTVDAVPVGHSQWKQTDAYPHWLYCQNCYKRIVPNIEWIERYNIPTNYCPNCGAKMEIENE